MERKLPMRESVHLIYYLSGHEKPNRKVQYSLKKKQTSTCLPFQIYTWTALEQSPNWWSDTYITREENISLLGPYIDTIHIKCRFSYVYRLIYYVTNDNEGQLKIIRLKWKIGGLLNLKYVSFSQKLFIHLNCCSVTLLCRAAGFMYSITPGNYIFCYADMFVYPFSIVHQSSPHF